jgi:signal transduction histidine kinase
MNPEWTARTELAQLRHQLRTPLNHILGYAEILLEDLGLDPRQNSEHPLISIYTCARQILELVQQALSPAFCEVTEADVSGLRASMLDPVQSIIRNVGLLANNADSAHLLDLLRINNAASELLGFAHGQVPRTTAAPRSLETSAESPELAAHVLLVDDDESNRDMLSRQLERTGCTVTCAEDGRDALRLIKDTHFDAVLLDIVMPEIDGLGVLEQICSQPDSVPKPPVIMISALDEMDSVRRCLELGAEDYLLKPFDPVLLRSRLTATLERSRLRSMERERTKALESALNRLRDINENLQQFAYAASHDLKSPIRTVTLMSQLLVRRYKGRLDPDADELIGNIIASMARMDDLVTALLSYSQLDTRSGEDTELPLDQPVEDALANLAQDIRATGATIEMGDLPTVTGRKAHFVQLFQNLIQNALKYRGPEPPHVRITAEYTSEECVIRVADNGIGFDSKYAEGIFEPFRRLHGQEYPGSGIGLAICGKIVAQYGGRIWAESEINKGSVFSFAIPSALCKPAEHRDACSTAVI